MFGLQQHWIIMDHFDDWLHHALEQGLGEVVEDKISAIQNLDTKLLGSVSDELVHTVCCSKETSELRTRLLNQDCDVLSHADNYATYDVAILSLTDGASKGGNGPSRCSSVNATPRNEKADDRISSSERRARTRPTPSSHRSATQRLQALEVLLKVPVGDIVGSANWPQLQQELCESLSDDNWCVFVRVLKVLSRLSSASLFSPVREGFLSLLEGLTLHYLTRHLHQQLPLALHGLQLDNEVHRRIVLISQCLLQILNVIPGKWVRYGEKRTQEILGNFVDLLSMHTHHNRTVSTDGSKDILYPFHIFSILDPEAKWCASVMHAAFGRSILMKCVLKSATLIRFIVEEVIIWLKGQMKISEGVTAVYECGDNGNINGNTINLTVFIHCISLLKMFINCDRGHSLFPVLTSIQEEGVTVYTLLLKIIEFLNKVSNVPKMRPSARLLKMLENVCATLILSRGTRILHGSSVELIHLLLEVPNRMDHYNLHSHNVNILCKISESPLALKWMLGRPSRRIRDGISHAFSDPRVSLSSASSSGRESVLANRTACVAPRVARATAASVKDSNRFTSESTSPICQLLNLSEKLFSIPEGYLLLESCEGQLIPLAGHLLIHIRNMMYNSDLGLLSIQQSLESFLVGITLTPMGFLSIFNIDGLLNCLLTCHIDRPVIAKYNEPMFLHLFQLMMFMSETKIRTHQKSLIKHVLNELWSAQDDTSEWVWQEAKSNLMKVILTTCATPTAVSYLLEDLDQSDSSSESTLVEETDPLSLKELFARSLQSTYDASSSYLLEVSFDVLHALAHNIDIALVLEEKFKLSECLQRILSNAQAKDPFNELSVQPSPRRDKTNVTDENAHMCNHIRSILSQIRDTSPWDIHWRPRCWSPRSPRIQVHTGRARAQTDLQRFLQDTRHGLHDSMWISHARRTYRASCRSELKVAVLVDLFDQVLQTQPSLSTCETSLRWPSGVASSSYSVQNTQAIDMVIRYGCQMKVLSGNMMNQHVQQLSLLLNQTQLFLARQKGSESFDWFVASVFLMCSGNLDRSRSVLQRVAMLPTGPFIWLSLSENTMQLSASINQHLQGLLAEYVPKAYNALLEEGVPWWIIADRLKSQAFLPVIPLSQLPHILALTALHSWEYNLYLHTAILAHIQPELLDKTLHQSIHLLLLEMRLDDFLLGDYLPFMDKLAKLNRPYVVRDRIATATL